MNIPSKKSLLALSISALLSLPLLTACGGSSSDNSNPNHSGQQGDNPGNGGSNPGNGGSNPGNGGENPGNGGETQTVTKNITAADPIQVAHWEGSSEDEYPIRFQATQFNDNKIIVSAATKWHNGIVHVDTANDNDIAANPIRFAELGTADHIKKDKKAKQLTKGLSTADDIVSGASEHMISDLEYSKDKKYAYVTTTIKYFDTDPNGKYFGYNPNGKGENDDTYGLFKVPLNADGSFPDHKVNGKPAFHRAAGVKRIADKDILYTLMLDNGNLLALTDKTSTEPVRYTYYDANLNELSTFALANNEVSKGWTSDNEAVYILVYNTETKTKVIQKRLLTDLTTVAVSVDANEDMKTMYNTSAGLLVVNEHKVQLLKKATLEETASKTVAFDIDQYSLSTDGKRLVIAHEVDRRRINELNFIEIDANSTDKPLSDLFTVDVSAHMNYDNDPNHKEKKVFDIAMADKDHVYYYSYISRNKETKQNYQFFVNKIKLTTETE